MQSKVTSLELFLTILLYPGKYLQLTPALVLSFNQSRGEEGSARQTVSRPKPGQAPKNEEAEGFPGKVSWTLPLCESVRDLSCVQTNLFLNWLLFWWTGWCLRALSASFVPSTRRRWKHTWRVAFIRTTLSSFLGSCPSQPQTSYRWLLKYLIKQI